MLPKMLNFVGLLLITIGGVGAAFVAPQSHYGPDGSVSLAPPSTTEQRIAIYKRQRLFPFLLVAVGAGAALQAVAIFV